MGIIETGVIYLLIGLGVGAAAYLREAGKTPLGRCLRCALSTAFWPLFLPVLLGGPPVPPAPGVPAGPAEPFEIDPRLRRAEESLLSALAGLGGVAEGALRPEVARIRELGGSLHAMSGRLREMDRLLATPEFDAGKAGALLTELGARLSGDDQRVASLRTRLRNIERLGALRARTAELLERALLKMEEMHSQVLLLRFAEDPEREVAELMRDIAASVDGLTEGLSAAA